MRALGEHSAPLVSPRRGTPPSRSSWLGHDPGQAAQNHAFWTRPEEVTLGRMMEMWKARGWRTSGGSSLGGYGGKRIGRAGMPLSLNLWQLLGMIQIRTMTHLIPNHA